MMALLIVAVDVVVSVVGDDVVILASGQPQGS